MKTPDRDALAAKLAEAEQELQSIDSVLARRPALDKPTRRENIEYAISTAAKAHAAIARAEAAEAELAKLGPVEWLRFPTERGVVSSDDGSPIAIRRVTGGVS